MCASWSGNWSSAVRQRVAQLDFDGPWQLAIAHPLIPFGQLFEMVRQTKLTALGIPQIGLIQFEAAFFEDASSARQLRTAMTDTLIRSFQQHLRKGWNCGKNIRNRHYHTQRDWALPPAPYEKVKALAEQIWANLEETNPPAEWCPLHWDDPVLTQAFDRAWPKSGWPFQ